MQSKKNICRRIRKEIREIKDDSVIGYIKRPNFSMSGNREFFAEGNISVDVYTDEIITFSASGICVRIEGRSLSMCFYSRTSMKITGYIIKLEFEKIR